MELNKGTYPVYTVENGMLLYKAWLVLPAHSFLIPNLLFEYHNSTVGGHGDLKTYLKLVNEWFWVGMRKQVAQYVRECMVCQQHKVSHQHPVGLLQTLPIPSQVREDITMDFIEGLPKSGGIDTIMVVMDRLTKFAHFVGLKHPFSTTSVAALLAKEIARLHGFPTSIVCNRDRVFLSIFWKELFRLQGTNLLRSTTYHPQTDGQSEKVNKSLETYLSVETLL